MVTPTNLNAFQMATPDEPWVACPVCKCAVTERKIARHLRRVHGEQAGSENAAPTEPPPPPRPAAAKSKLPAAAFGSGRKPPLHSRTVKCPSCSYMINETLLEGHVEACRARKRKQAAQARKKAQGGEQPMKVSTGKRRRKKAKRTPPAGADIYAAGLVVEKGRTDWRHRQS